MSVLCPVMGGCQFNIVGATTATIVRPNRHKRYVKHKMQPIVTDVPWLNRSSCRLGGCQHDAGRCECWRQISMDSLVRGAGSCRSISAARARAAAHQLHVAAAVNRRDRQSDGRTDGRTPYRYTDAHRSKRTAPIKTVVVKFKEIILKFKKVRDPHSITTVIRRHSEFSIF